jgi:hypothetical protein
MINLESGLDIDKLNHVRRRMSLEMNIDYTNSQIVEKLISMEFSSVTNKSKYKDAKSKFDKIRRKLSYELDREIKSSEVMPLILERAFNNSKIKIYKPTKVNPQLLYEELSKGTTADKCAEKFGVSRMTIFRAKAKLREMNC